jgi:Holliday junction resolvase RusA-like endonuclease
MHVGIAVKPRTHFETRWNPRGFAYKTREAKEYAAELEEAIAAEVHRTPLTGLLQVQIWLTKGVITIDVQEWEGNKAKLTGDVDNYAKPILDAGNKRIWNDDSQIQQLSITKY